MATSDTVGIASICLIKQFLGVNILEFYRVFLRYTQQNIFVGFGKNIYICELLNTLFYY